MITFYIDVDVDDNEITTMFIHIDDEFFKHISNYLKLENLKDQKKPCGFITPSELEYKVNNLPHEWLLQQPEIQQLINGKLYIVQTKFTEKYIKELKKELIRMAKLAQDKNAIIRWE